MWKVYPSALNTSIEAAARLDSETRMSATLEDPPVIETPVEEIQPIVEVKPLKKYGLLSRMFVNDKRLSKLSFDKIDWINLGGIASLHLLALGAFFVPFTWAAFNTSMVLWWLTGGLGICLCYHRLLTHRSFQTSKPMEYFLVIMGVLNWQGPPIRWVGGHRLHHKHSDTDDDPHTPHHGFGWSHVLWCFTRDECGRNARDAAKDLQRDPGLMFIDKWHSIPQFILAGILFTVGHFWQDAGLTWVIWGVGVRTVFVYHVTWFVNSAAHTWGYRTFQTDDGSRNTWWVALVSFGEGWHNNHHAQQRSAAHGMRWWEVDLTWWTILAMEKLGLATEVVRPKLPRETIVVR